MAIRQNLMWYYKRVELDGMHTNIILDSSLFNTRFRYNYERDRFRRDVPCHMYIGTSQIAELHKSPASLTFYMHTWGRSPEMQAVYLGVRLAVNEYLLGVKVDEIDKGERDIPNNGDEHLIRQNRINSRKYVEGDRERTANREGFTLGTDMYTLDELRRMNIPVPSYSPFDERTVSAINLNISEDDLPF
jgi:hypothetical protein